MFMVFACLGEGEGRQAGDFKAWCVGMLLMGLLDGCQGDTEEVHVTVPATAQGARSDICVHVHGICLCLGEGEGRQGWGL